MRSLSIVVMLGLVFSLSPNVWASEKEEATQAAAEILSTLTNKKYHKLWDSYTSEYIKSQTNKDAFLANMSMSRQMFGNYLDSKVLEVSVIDNDPMTGFKARIYAINYKTTYSTGKFYERIVMIKEKDGKFRLSGLWANPVPLE